MKDLYDILQMKVSREGTLFSLINVHKRTRLLFCELVVFLLLDMNEFQFYGFLFLSPEESSLLFKTRRTFFRSL